MTSTGIATGRVVRRNRSAAFRSTPAAYTMTTQALVQVIQQARDEAKEILTGLERIGHPETSGSTSLYLGLVMLQKRVAAKGADASLAEFAPELDQFAELCGGELAPLKARLEEAAGIARGGKA